jgi:hypothetical protein
MLSSGYVQQAYLAVMSRPTAQKATVKSIGDFIVRIRLFELSIIEVEVDLQPQSGVMLWV